MVVKNKEWGKIGKSSLDAKTGPVNIESRPVPQAEDMILKWHIFIQIQPMLVVEA